MAAITTAQAGNWSAAATWTGGVVPGNGDTVTLNHDVTVDVAIIVGSSPASLGTAAIAWGTVDHVLTINANLTLRGDIIPQSAGSTDANLIVQAAGTTVEFDASQATDPSGTQYRIVNSDFDVFQLWHWVMNGTEASPCVLQSNADGGNAWHDRNSQLGGFFHATYGHFIRMGDATHPLLDSYVGTHSPEIYFDHCVFDACGEIQYGGSATSTAVITVKNNVWKNGVGEDSGLSNRQVDLLLPVGSDASEFSVDQNYFGGALALETGIGGTFTECVVVGSIQGTSTDAGPTLVQNCLHGIDTGSNLLSTASYDGCYFMAFDSTNDNPHGPNAASGHDSGVINSVFESAYTAAGGGDFTFVASGGSNAFALTNNILLPSPDGKAPGKLLSCLTVDGTSSVTVEHNTVISDLSGSTETGVVQYGETGGGSAGEIASLKSNLVWCNTADKGAILTRLAGTLQGEVSAADADYNAIWNAASDGVNVAGYYDEGSPAANLFSSGTPGAHDITLSANPFVDSTRNFAAWGTSLGGAGTNADTLARLRLRLDWTDADYAPDNGATVAALVAWVRDGFQVTNSALKNAGHDGATIGAMGFVTLGGQKWLPFRFACRLRSLRQGSLNVGNTRQNAANLQSLCTTEANGSAVYARWNTTLKNGSAQPVQALEVSPPDVPGYMKPVAS